MCEWRKEVGRLKRKYCAKVVKVSRHECFRRNGGSRRIAMAFKGEMGDGAAGGRSLQKLPSKKALSRPPAARVTLALQAWTF